MIKKYVPTCLFVSFIFSLMFNFNPIFVSVAHSRLLLVPDREINYSDYSKSCIKPEYLCTTDYFLSLLKNRHREQSTEQFDKLIDSVDLNSVNFIDKLRNKIIGILNSEYLNRTQLSMLINLLEQIHVQQPTLLFKMMQNELVTIQTILDQTTQSGQNRHSGQFVFIFNETISIADAKKIRTNILKIPMYVLHFSSIPSKTNTFDFAIAANKKHHYLLSASCGKSQLTYKIKMVKYCPTTRIKKINKITSDIRMSVITKELYY